ncbi:hypothetical protein BH20ACT21_BH20ACT21_03750 [soil metagenome]
MKNRGQPPSRYEWRSVWKLLASLVAAVVRHLPRVGEELDGEARMDRSPDASLHVSRVRSDAIGDLWIGGVTLIAALAAFISMATSAPWQLRLAVVFLAVLFGPAPPALRLLTSLSLLEAVIVGVSLDVALIMGIGQSLLLARTWQPVIAFGMFVTAGAIASLLLLVAARIER